MRPIFLSLLVLFVISNQFAVGQSYWAQRQAGGNVDETLGVTSDNEGNSYATGYFSTSAEINGENLLVEGLTDIFVSKVLPSGLTEWSVSFGGSQSDRGLGITVDKTGKILVCGFYTGNVDFGNGVSLTSAGGQDAFVLKLDENGEALWAKGGGSIQNSDRSNAVAADSSGNVLVTGQFSGDANFGSFNLNASDGSIDAFIIKYDENGNELWAKQGSGEALERGMGIATDSENGVYITGQFSGDITFDNVYDNNVLNAVFLIKYSTEGDEQWLRTAGGTEEAIAYGITSDGVNVFLTGDYGESISVLGDGLPITIESGFSESIFIMSFSPNGQYLWSASAGSESLVSSRAIDQHNGELSIAGFYRCTFDSYSEEYGSATFNSIGFEDAFASRYSSENGDFLWARNFGSRNDEQALTVSLLPDNSEVIGGVFKEELIFPSVGFLWGNNLDAIGPSFGGVVHCDDSNYEAFYRLEGDFDQDGFLLRVLTENRAPYDYFFREEFSGCDPSVLNPCIYNPNDSNVNLFACEDTIPICLNDNLSFSSLTRFDNVAFDYDFDWSNPNGSTSSQVTTEGEFSIEIVSEDGCYTYSDEAYITIAPAVAPALISDNVIVNNQAANTSLITVCEGDSVLLWADYPDTLSGTWSGWSIENTPGQDTLLLTTQEGLFDIAVSNEFGCSASNFVEVEFIPIALDLPVELSFPQESDSISICENDSWGIVINDFIEGTDQPYPDEGYIKTWEVNLGATIGGNYFIPIQEGWHVVTLTVEPIINECNEIPFVYTDVDSIYVSLLEAPEIFISVTGPTVMCPGDTIVLQYEYTGSLNNTAGVAQSFVDSAYITSPGLYYFTVDSTSENGCTNWAEDNHLVSIVTSPQIFTDPPNAVICPGDSVQLLSNNEGDFLWQGPVESVDGDNSLWVDESGLYFAEVTFYEGCALVSNTVQLAEYSTPFLYAEDETVCQGGSTDIWVFSNSLETINWLPPLSGNDSIQTVFDPGIYSVTVTGCDITTDISIEIIQNEPVVQISLVDNEPQCEGDSIQVQADGDFVEYIWTPDGQGSSTWFDSAGPVSVNALTDEGCQAVSNTLELNFEPTPPNPPFQFELPCIGESMEILISTDLDANILDAQGGTVISNDSIQYIEALVGDTIIYAFLTSEYCIGDTLPLELSPKLYPDDPIPASDAPVCTGTNLSLEVLNAETEVDYTWLMPNGDIANGDQVTYGISDLSQEGDYLAYADKEGCLSDTVGIPVSLFETRQVILPPDTALCYFEDFFIYADTVFASYLWADNSTDSVFYPSADNTEPIFLIATDFNGCESVDFMEIDFFDCLVVVPNIITPNGDGLNDEWAIELDNPQFFQALVYNRSGRKVYESNDHFRKWDGTNSNSGDPCPEGTYFFVVQVNDFEGRLIEKQGYLTIARD